MKKTWFNYDDEQNSINMMKHDETVRHGAEKTLLVLLKPQPQLHCCRDIAASRSV
jgi:hypothetical protein